MPRLLCSSLGEQEWEVRERKSQGDGGNRTLSNQAAKGRQCPVRLGNGGGGQGAFCERAHSVWERQAMRMKGVREEARGSEDHKVG